MLQANLNSTSNSIFSAMKPAEFKQHLDKFTTISNEEFDAILNYFSSVQMKKNEVLIEPGKRVDKTYWVVKGLLISTYTDDKGKEHVIQFADENCWITDQVAFYQRTQSTYTITCLEKTTLLSISFDQREALCRDFESMNTFFRRKANDSFVKQQKRLLHYMVDDVTDRYYNLLSEYPHLIQRLPKKILAAYLGTSRESLSRLKK